ncbi:hypothetical protein FAEPRAA2165_01934 [Faecalibacterium duncaniae]|uniref:Uncharacterized protein n=1 Tax=Faecalibacterium duncaniae (strain DSM 17677 / JCM 31915 / A2-165) TaxID=411483 RepID=C7H6K1_FAED2|nr:hypothetical protein FAEPRAA2165_01934 [Faecalibacterium duncaniae]
MKNLKINVSAPYIFSLEKAGPADPLDEPIKTDYDVGRERLEFAGSARKREPEQEDAI